MVIIMYKKWIKNNAVFLPRVDWAHEVLRRDARGRIRFDQQLFLLERAPPPANKRKEHVLSESESFVVFVPSLSWQMIDCQKIARQKSSCIVSHREEFQGAHSEPYLPVSGSGLAQ